MDRTIPKSVITGALVPNVSTWGVTQVIECEVPFTPGQRAVIKSLDRMDEMTEEEASVYTKMTGLKPWQVGDQAPHFHELVLPRGAGKTYISCLVALRDALSNEYTGAPGETQLIALMCPTLRQARDAMRYLTSFCEHAAVASFVISQTTDEIRFCNGRIIRAVPVDKRGGKIRGATFLTLIQDEAGYLEHSGVMIDREIFNAVVAGFRNVPDYRALVISTPNGRTGLLWDVYDQHYGEPNSDWSVFHTDITTIRPDMDAALLNQIRSSDLDSFKVEFLCEFSAGGAKRFFNEHYVEAAIQKGIVKIQPDGLASEYFAAVDVSGGKHDRHTVTVVRRLEDHTIQQVASLVLDPNVDTYTMRDAARQAAELCAEYGVNQVCCDVYGGNYAVEAHAEFGLQCEIRGMNNTEKIKRARAMSELLQNEKLMLLDLPLQTSEILQYEKRELPSGNVTCGHPNRKGASDDLLDSLLLAMYESIGNVSELHPPEELSTYGWDKQKVKALYNGMYPGPAQVGNRLVKSHDEIAALGEAPKWLAQNCLKSPDFALYSLGELSFHSGLTPGQLMCHLGKTAVLCHAWMRWVLATEKDNIAEIVKINFPEIPAWSAIKRRVIAAGNINEVITFGYLSSPFDSENYEYFPSKDSYIVHGPGWVGHWPPDIFCRRASKAKMPACPPWTAPLKSWGGFPEDHEACEWTEQKHSELIEGIFRRGQAEQRAAEHRRNKVARMQKQATPQQSEEFTERLKNHTFDGGGW